MSECIFTYTDYYGHGGLEEFLDHNENLASMTFDLHGRPVANPQPGSIYIRNGRKIVVPAN